MSGAAKVLIVDDDAFSRAVAAGKLGKLGATTVEAESGEEALRRLGQDDYSLVLLDLDMPMMSGFDLLGCIRGHPDWSHLPVVVLTGCEDRHSLEHALMAGATSFLIKPLNWSAFGGHIRHLLELSRWRRAAQSREDKPLFAANATQTLGAL